MKKNEKMKKKKFPASQSFLLVYLITIKTMNSSNYTKSKTKLALNTYKMVFNNFYNTNDYAITV